MEVLLIDTDPDLEQYLSSMIRSRLQAVRLRRVNNSSEAMAHLSAADRPAYDAILIDNRPEKGSNFFRVLDRLLAFDIPVIILGSDTSERAVVEAIRRGASDYISRRSLKYERLPAILERAVIDRGSQLAIQRLRQEMAANMDSKALDYQILLHMEEDRVEMNRKQVARGQIIQLPALNDGDMVDIVFLYVIFDQLKKPDEVVEDSVLKERENRTRTELEGVVPDYGGLILSRGNRFMLIAMPSENPVQAVLLALEMKAALQLEVLKHEDLPDHITSGMGVAQDRTTYRARSGDMVSSGINLAAHMAFEQMKSNGLMTTGDILSQLGKRTMNYFQPAPDFEGWKVHTYIDLA